MLRHLPRISNGLVATVLTALILVFPPGQSSAFAAAGDTDSALVLNGSNQYAAVSDSGSSPFDNTGTITIEAWVYPTTACTSSQVVMTKDTSYMMYCYLGKWMYAYSANGTSWNGDYTSIPVEANAWHHIAYTHSASSTNLKVFYDGVNVETLTANMPTGMTPNNNSFQIGRSGASSYFQGRIDEVRVYNSQRTDAQIYSDMTSYGSTSDANLIAYYDFNDQSGSTIANEDATPAANSDLTSYNSPTYSNIESTTVINGDQVVTFPRSYLTVNGGWKVPSYVSTVRSLVIAGGGGGGSRAGGGGGAGGYVYDASLPISANSNIAIIVGTGGIGYLNRQGAKGNNSQLGSLRTTLGGGGGGAARDAFDTYRAGSSGGSGGGASPSNTGSGASAGVGSGLQFSTYGYGSGFAGGAAAINSSWMGGGGGGAASTGENANTIANYTGKGGSGYLDPIGGTTSCYATGGSGGNSGGAAGAPGACSGTSVTNNNSGTTSNFPPGVTTPNTGSGGGGSGYTSGADVAGGSGSAGIIILRYALNMSVTLSFSGGTEATYRAVGTITATNALPGKVTFYEKGKAIPGCKNLPTNGSNVATCSWRPSLHGSTTITATAKPSNTYVSNGSSALNIAVTARSGKR